VKGREKSREGAGDEGMEMEGTGGPLSQILDTPLTVQRTRDLGCNTASGVFRGGGQLCDRPPLA
jgi:hypothetical protein